MMRRVLPRRLVAGLLLVLLSLVGSMGIAGPAAAAPDPEGASVSHVQTTDGTLQVLVSVPPRVQVDLDEVRLSVAGEELTTAAEPAGGAAVDVRRATVLAIDVSVSMRGARFAAAREAASVFLDSVPDDVEVGVVTFAGEVVRALAPTSDRAAAREVIAGLELSRGTALYEGVIAAVAASGTEGQRRVLVLSDGKDSTATELGRATAAIEDAGAAVDVVTLHPRDDGQALQALARAGSGELISASSGNLAAAFSAQAAELTRQLLVSAPLPVGLPAEATVAVTVPTQDGVLSAEAFAQVGAAVPEGPATAAAAGADSPLRIPEPLLYAGIGALGLGLLVVMALLFTGRPATTGAPTVEDRIAAYGARRSTGGGHRDEGGETLTAQATVAAAGVLHHNRGLEARIATRLEGSGSALKPAEWLLVHGGIAIMAGFVGLLLGRGSILMILLCLALGAVLPWLYLGLRKSRRLSAFDAGLADTLQLVAGSLQAGLSLGQALDTVVREGNEPISGEFKRVLVESRLGVPLEASLDDMATRMESKDFGWVVMAIRIQREVGGNLAELLLTVSATLREREYLRRQVKTLSAEGRLSCYVLGGLPPLFLLYLLMVRRDYVMPLFTEPIGLLMLVAAGTLLSVGIFWMSRLVKVEV